MKEIIVLILVLVSLFSCSKSDVVQVSGRIENGDSIVSILVDDSIYTLSLDQQGFFSGKIDMVKGGYATMLHNALNLYLSPGEDLEIYVNAKNFSGSLYFRGSLGGINDAKYRPGEFRETDDVVIADYDGNIVHQPPAAALLPERLEKVCQWLNSHEGYIHPLVRACILHFMLAHEHPFRDGNGRTSRALFYWYMLKSGYDVFKYISISRLLHAAPVKYAASYQYTESDGMDLTYFLEYQAGVIKRALQNWQQHIDEITQRSAKLDSVLFSSGVLKRLNPRQVTLLNVMLANPGKEYTVAEISASLGVSDNTARADLRTIVKEGFAQEKKINDQQAVYFAHYPL